MNLHSLGPEPSASANSATSACVIALKFYTAELTEAEHFALSASVSNFTRRDLSETGHTILRLYTFKVLVYIIISEIKSQQFLRIY